MADVLDFEVRIKAAEEDINKLNAQLRAIANNAEDTGERMDDAFTKVGKTIGAVFATAQLVDFAKQVVNVRKEIESYEISFRTLLGSQEKADALFGSLREFAVKTPMQLGDLAKGAQTLLGFGIEAEKIMPTLKQIGDISMGNAEKFGSLTLAFAQMSSSGKLMGQDLLQMINAGFNPLSIISQKTGKSIGELKKEMEKGAISVEMVADAFKTATSEGGMFYGMLEKQGEGLAGAIAQLQGAWEEALNDIGERTQDITVAGFKGVTKLVENYDKLIAVILGVASAYGTYKAALMATVAINQAKMFADNIRLIAMFRKELGLLKAAQQAFNLTAMKNPYILLASAIVGVGVALYSFINRTDEATKKQEEFNKALGDRTSGTIGKFKTMSLEWEKMGDDFKAKEQYIIDNKFAFAELGIAVQSVADAERALIDNKDEFINSYIAKAKAVLYQEEANALIAKQVENQKKIEDLTANPYTKEVKDLSVSPYTTADGQTIWSYKTVVDTEKTEKELKELEKENIKLQKEIDATLGKVIAEENKTVEPETTTTTTEEEIEKVTTFAKDANEQAQRMEDENFQNRLRHEAELARVRGENLEEYYNKEQKAIDNEYQTKVRNIEREREEALKNAKQEDKGEINTAFNRRISAEENAWMLQTEQNTQAREAALNKERLDKYQQFVEEYVRIERDRQSRIDELRKQAQDGNLTADEYALRVVQSDNIALAEKTTLQAELGLTAEEVTSLISGVVTETVGLSLDVIRNQLPALKAELNDLRASGADPAEIAKLTGKIQVMEGALNDAKKTTTQISDTSKKTAKESEGDWQIVAQSLSVVNGALDEVMNTFGDMMSESGKTAISVMQTTLSATTGVIQAITMTSQTATGAIKAAETASVVLAIISAAVQVIMAITKAIMQNFSAQAKYEKAMEEHQNRLEELQKEHEKLKRSFKDETGVNYWQELSKSVEEYTRQVDEARKAEATARRERDRLRNKYGEDSKKAQEAEEEYSQAQETTQSIIDKGKEELKDIFEKMATTDVTSFGEEMAEALVDSFTKGLNGMQGAWDDTINNMIKSMLTQRLALQLTDQFEDAFKYLERATSTENGRDVTISDYEMSQFLEKMGTAKAGAMAIGEEYQKLFAELGLLDDTIDAENKGFQSMSQDTADELNGRFTALQISGANIDATLREQLQANKAGLALVNTIQENVELMSQIASSQLQELKNIAMNTALLSDTNNMLKSIKEHTARL